MKNKNIFLSFCAMVLVLTQFSCVEDVPVSEVTNVPFDIESVSTPSITTSEKNVTYTVDFKLDDRQIVNTIVDVSIDEVNTTATNGVDFNFTPVSVEIPAYVRDGSFSFDIVEDLAAEGDEVIKFVIGPHDAPFSVGNSRDVDVTIQDSVYKTLNLTFDWGGTFDYGGSPYSICPNVDMDFYVMNAAGEGQGIYGAATGACPEFLIVDETWGDGDFFIMSQLYNNELDGYGLGIQYPITVTAEKGGAFSSTFAPVEVWNSDDTDAVHGGEYLFKPVVEINISGSTYTLKNLAGEVIASGITGPKINR